MKSMSVMVVDDEPNVCRSVHRILNRNGYEVVQELCVSDALGHLEAGMLCDLIVADLMMPQAGGLELLKVVRERWPHTPVLIITGYASIASAVESARFGAAGYLQKPFAPEELKEAVEKALLAAATAGSESEVEESAPSDAIDVDLPFDRNALTAATTPLYVGHLGRSDLPIVPAWATHTESNCEKERWQCQRVVKQGVGSQLTGTQAVGEQRKVSRTNVVVPIADDPIDVDMPFSRAEVAAVAGEAYVAALGRSDMPVIGRWQSSAKNPRVLVVDDEAVVVNSIRKTLSRKSFRIDGAYTGAEALARVARTSYDLVLLDMRLPDADGLELIGQLRIGRPNLRIVIVTGYASIDTAVEAIRRGADDYMAKPFTPEELEGTAARVLAAA